jgi:hypothetical protein
MTPGQLWSIVFTLVCVAAIVRFLTAKTTSYGPTRPYQPADAAPRATAAS